ncbi:NB-ARC domain-containing protein [Mycobacterium barrassiae]|uniref:NB-ARC domain-containing protein n=1 Tax=Mycobacterium barrassiae TaxID=319709 RepID=UPI0027E253C1|nr:NB-ARC domain-containing protein [Mycobacterium barrassiae]
MVTFLFTDIEGSTRRWESDADEMRSALAAHDKVLRSAIEAHEGFVFSHSGDGMAAAFSSPMAAIDAAIDAQRELQLPVRMGIATGEAELRDNDYFGTVLNRAARVMAAGHGGQILVAESTAGLLSGVDLIDLGSRRLRDLPNPVRVYQLQVQGLRSDFPPLRTLDPTLGNLRRATSAFIGREAEVAEIATLLRSRRMVTLTGVGGVGKTRLAVEVAAQLSGEFPDGIWVFELAAVSDPVVVPEAVAAVMGITQQPGHTMTESVAAALEGRRRLLVFDNCEHLLDAVGDLAEAILAASATSTILATGREGLALADEQVWPVRSLNVDAATELFIERARQVAPTLQIDNANVVADVCRRLDGIPLAIELAASRMSSMAVEEIRDHLDHRFKLLVGSRRALGRHQTLRQAVAWSYDLLSDAEKQLLERCSVFAGGFDIEGACAVAGFESDSYHVLDLLDALVRKSLVIAERTSGRTRFSMLETIREFADEKLVDHGGGVEARDAHAGYYAGREAEIMAVWDSPRQRETYRWFGTELSNLRSAFRWTADREQIDPAATIATYAALLGFCIENYEPVTWAEELIETARAVNHRRLAYLCTMASGCWFVGRLEEAVRYSDSGHAALRTSADEIPFGFAGILGSPYLAIGQPDQAVEQCRTRLAERGNKHPVIVADLVMFLTIAGRDEEAMAATDGLLASAEDTSNPFAVSLALMALGFAWRNADPDRALAATRRGLAIARDSGNRFNESHLTANLAQLDAERGDPLSALDHIGLAIRHMHDSGNIVTVRSPLANLAIFLDGIGQYEAAATVAGFAFSPLMRASFPNLEVAVAHLRGVLGEPAYESFASKGRSMTTAAMAAYAYEQIDQTRAQLEQLR